MTISLTHRQEKLVRDLVQSGRYQDDTEAVQKGLELLQKYESKLSELRAEIQKGVDSGEPTLLDRVALKVKVQEQLKP